MRWLLVSLLGGACLSVLAAGCQAPAGAAQDVLERLGIRGNTIRAGVATATAVVAAAPTNTPTRAATPTVTPPPPTATPIPTATPLPKPIAVLAKGFGQNLGPASYAFVVENPNPALAIENTIFQVALYDEAGTVLRTDNGTIGLLLPGEKLGVAGDVAMMKQDPKVARVEVQVQPGAFTATNLKPALSVDNVSYRHDIWFPRVTGVVKSQFPKTIDRVRVSALLYDKAGDIIGGGSGYIKFVPSKGDAAVQINVITASRPDSLELYPMVGALSQLQ